MTILAAILALAAILPPPLPRPGEVQQSRAASEAPVQAVTFAAKTLSWTLFCPTIAPRYRIDASTNLTTWELHSIAPTNWTVLVDCEDLPQRFFRMVPLAEDDTPPSSRPVEGRTRTLQWDRDDNAGLHRIFQSTNLRNWTLIATLPGDARSHRVRVDRVEPVRFYKVEAIATNAINNNIP